MKKLTPKQAFEHLKAVVPSLEYIEPAEAVEGCGESIVMKFVYDDGSRGIRQLADTAIIWSTHQRWPKEPGTWRTPVLPADAGKTCRVRDYIVDEWRTASLSGYSTMGGNYCWIDDTETGWALCEVFEPAPIRPARKARTRASKKTRKSAR